MRPTPLRPRTVGGGRAAGSTTPQLPECAEDGYPGKGPPCTRPAHSPVPPTLTRPVGKSVAGLLNSSRSRAVCPTVQAPASASALVGGERPLPRTFQRSRWGQNSKLRWHRAAPVHHCSRWLSKAKKGLGGGSSGGWRPEHQLQPPHHITQMCLCHRSTKNFCQAAHISPPLLRTDYCAGCRF